MRTVNGLTVRRVRAATEWPHQTRFMIRSERPEFGPRSAAVHGYGEHHRAKIGVRSRIVNRGPHNDCVKETP